MIIAVKGNREEKISDDQKNTYLSNGYDIIENGKRTVSPSKKFLMLNMLSYMKKTKN